MPNIKLIIEYDGSRFHGWQIQPGVRTVQEELTKVVSMVLREPIRIIHASGRTDAGVHARGQVVSFKSQNAPDLLRLSHAVSSILKGDLAVRSAEIVPDSFHARGSAKSKQYSYFIHNSPTPPVLLYGRVWHVTRPLPLNLLQEESRAFIGEHDFTSVRAADCQGRSPVKTIHELEIKEVMEDLIQIRVVGSGFLKQMVRIIVGTLVDIGKGRIPNDGSSHSIVEQVLAKKTRLAAGITAPPQGLCLDFVTY
jgi:tRNA pseudouridine38-40 synthase